MEDAPTSPASYSLSGGKAASRWQSDRWQAVTSRVADDWRETTHRWATSPGWKATTYHWAATQKRRLLGTRRARITTAIVCACLLLCTLGSLPLYIAYAAQYQQIMRNAHDGLQHLKNAETSFKAIAKNPFDLKSVTQARTELAAANHDFTLVDTQLKQLPSAARALPIAGSKLSAALRLVPLAVEGTQAGVLGCDALSVLISSLKDPLNPKAQGLTSANLTVIDHDFAQIQTLFNTIVGQITSLQPSDLTLDARLGPAVAAFKAKLPQIKQAVQDAQTMLGLAPLLLGVGKPTNYLVEVMDSTELRPGGGFVGNYGILTLSGGRLSGLHIQDVDLLDSSVKYGSQTISIPSTYNWFTTYTRWGFRDSNLDADFPTDARNGEQLYKQEGGTDQVQGVIAITPWLIQNAMKITGPIYVNEYNETVTPQNLVDRIHYYALTAGVAAGPDTTYDPSSQTSLRKRFTGYLFTHFLAKVKQVMPQEMSKFVQLFIDSLHSKDVQIYLNPSSAEALLQRYHLASTIQAPATGDSVFEVDANIGANKSNYFLTYAMSDQISIDQSGTATHHLTVTYTWPPNPVSLVKDYAAGVANRYHSYSRVYVPPAAVLQSEKGWVAPTSSTAFDRKVWGGTTYVYYGTTLTISLTWKVPGAATHDASGWHYRLLFQKQSGITWQLNLQVTLPTCATIKSAPTGFASTGPHATGVKEPLLNDLNLDFDYTC